MAVRRVKYTVHLHPASGTDPRGAGPRTRLEGMLDAPAPPSGSRRTSGAWLVGGMLALGMALAVFGVWYQWGQTRRCLAFYGSEAAHRIQVAPRVELWRLDPAGAAVRPESDRCTDVSRARGLVHLRRGLVEDANFAWDETPAPVRPAPAIVLAFFDHADDVDPKTVVVVHLDERGGWLEVAGRPGVLALGRIVAGLRTWLQDVAPAPAPADGPHSGLKSGF